VTSTITDPDTLPVNTMCSLCMETIQPDEAGHSGTPIGIAPVTKGRRAVHAAIDESTPAPVITAALESHGLGTFNDELLPTMRSEFGGHAEKRV
jgi:6-phosphogluconate dehydrogenase (decarboxylating)